MAEDRHPCWELSCDVAEPRCDDCHLWKSEMPGRWGHYPDPDKDAYWLCPECQSIRAKRVRKQQREKKYSDPPPTGHWG
jgi:hypothetical protein